MPDPSGWLGVCGPSSVPLALIPPSGGDAREAPAALRRPVGSDWFGLIACILGVWFAWRPVRHQHI